MHNCLRDWDNSLAQALAGFLILLKSNHDCGQSKRIWYGDAATISVSELQHGGKADLIQVNHITKDINEMRGQMNHFWRVMVLNVERLGIQIGCEEVDTNLSLAIQGAQKDFVTIHTRMQPLRERS